MIDEVKDYAILLLSPEGIVENWNSGAESIKGYKAEEIVGKAIPFIPAGSKGGAESRLDQSGFGNHCAVGK